MLWGHKWVFKTRPKTDEILQNLKGSGLQKDFSKPMVQTIRTFSPEIKPTIYYIMRVHSLAATNDWHVQKIDINKVFLYEELKK